MYAVLKFAARETVSADAALKILKTFRDVVEPFFAIARGDPEGDYLCDAAERAAADAEATAPPQPRVGEDGDDEVRPWAWVSIDPSCFTSNAPVTVRRPITPPC